jgi:CRISPR-associated protein Cas1
MLVRNIEETYIFIEEINNLIIESNQCIISTELINQAIKNNINLIFCDEKHSPNSQLIGLNNNYNGPKNLLKQIK